MARGQVVDGAGDVRVAEGAAPSGPSPSAPTGATKASGVRQDHGVHLGMGQVVGAAEDVADLVVDARFRRRRTPRPRGRRRPARRRARRGRPARATTRGSPPRQDADALLGHQRRDRDWRRPRTGPRRSGRAAFMPDGPAIDGRQRERQHRVVDDGLRLDARDRVRSPCGRRWSAPDRRHLGARVRRRDGQDRQPAARARRLAEAGGRAAADASRRRRRRSRAASRRAASRSVDRDVGPDVVDARRRSGGPSRSAAGRPRRAPERSAMSSTRVAPSRSSSSGTRVEGARRRRPPGPAARRSVNGSHRSGQPRG